MGQVKVTKKETYKDSQKGDTIVCNGKLILIESDSDNIDEVNKLLYIGISYYKPIIISETEKMEVGDKVLYQGKEILTLLDTDEFCGFEEDGGKGTVRISQCKKIIAFPENFSPKQMEAIADGKLKDGDLVLVRCVYKTYQDANLKTGKVIESNGYYQINLNKENNITLFPVKKEESWKDITREFRKYRSGLDGI